ncbi:MAG: GNAT family N-acetyltransferase [Bacteroidota bacterium]
MKIIHLTRQSIDEAAWDASLAKSTNRRIYAASWYLDLVTNQQWNALVSTDYQYLFPLPFHRKLLGLAQVQRPFLCQQLGLFGPSISPSILSEFIRAIPESYRRIELSLNSECRLEALAVRTNFELSLQGSITEIRAHYSKSLKKRIRRATAHLSLTATDDIPTIVELYQAEIGARLGWTKATFSRVQRILKSCHARGQLKAYLVHHTASGKLVAGGCFLLGFDRVINVFGAANQAGKELSATHFLTDQVIEIHQATHSIFDFEGSDIPGIAAFFQSFAPALVPYYHLQRDTLPSVLTYLLKLIR